MEVAPVRAEEGAQAVTVTFHLVLNGKNVGPKENANKDLEYFKIRSRSM